MPPTDTRPITRSDYDRLCSILEAITRFLSDSPHYAEFAGFLERSQEQANILARDLRREAGTAEEYVKREIGQALRLISAVSRGEDEISVQTSQRSVCVVTGCARLTDHGFDECIDHWLVKVED